MRPVSTLLTGVTLAAGSILTGASTVPAAPAAGGDSNALHELAGRLAGDDDRSVAGRFRTSAAAAGDVQQSSRFVRTQVGPDGRTERIEVIRRNGDVEVRVNGEDLSADRVRVEDGRVVILDPDGSVKETIVIAGVPLASGGADPFRVFSSDDRDRGLQWYTTSPQAPAASPPPVMLGITMSEPGPALEAHLGLDAGSSVMISSVVPGMPAAKAGLQEYDVVVAIDGAPPADDDTLRAALHAMEPGDVITLGVIQRGARRDVEVTVVEWQPQSAAQTFVTTPFGNAPSDMRIFAPRTPQAPTVTGVPLAPRAPGAPGAPGGPAADDELFFEIFVPGGSSFFGGDPNLQRRTLPGLDREQFEELERLMKMFDRDTAGSMAEVMEQLRGRLDRELPMIEVRVQKAIEQAEQGRQHVTGRVEQRLDAVEQRLVEMESMLRELLERRRPRRGGDDPSTT